VACDQPFEKVEEEFVKLIIYACHPAPCETFWLGSPLSGNEETVNSIHEMFVVGEI
jgi:hypothetical protein